MKVDKNIDLEGRDGFPSVLQYRLDDNKINFFAKGMSREVL